MTNDPSPPTASDTKASTRILKYKRLSARIIHIQSVNATDKRPWHLLAAELAHHPNTYVEIAPNNDSTERLADVRARLAHLQVGVRT